MYEALRSCVVPVGFLSMQSACGLLLACTALNFSFTHSSLLFVIIPELCLFTCTCLYSHKKKQLFGKVHVI